MFIPASNFSCQNTNLCCKRNAQQQKSLLPVTPEEPGVRPGEKVPITLLEVHPSGTATNQRLARKKSWFGKNQQEKLCCPLFVSDESKSSSVHRMMDNPANLIFERLCNLILETISFRRSDQGVRSGRSNWDSRQIKFTCVIRWQMRQTIDALPQIKQKLPQNINPVCQESGHTGQCFGGICGPPLPATFFRVLYTAS